MAMVAMVTLSFQSCLAATVHDTAGIQDASSDPLKPYYPESAESLLELLGNLRSEFQAEEAQDALQLKEAVDHHKRRKDAARKAAGAKTKLTERLELLKKSYKNATAAWKKRSLEYSMHQHSRDKEMTALGNIKQAVRELQEATREHSSSALTTDAGLSQMAKQAESRAKLTKTVTESLQLASPSSREQMKGVLVELQNPVIRHAEIDKAVKKMAAEIEARHKREASSVLELKSAAQKVKAELDVAQAKLDAFKDTVAITDTDTAQDGEAVIKDLRAAHKTAGFLRKSEIKTIGQIEAKIKQLFSAYPVEQTAGTAGELQLLQATMGNEEMASTAVRAARQVYESQAALAKTLSAMKLLKEIRSLVKKMADGISAETKLNNAYLQKYTAHKRNAAKAVEASETSSALAKHQLFEAAQKYEKALQDEKASQRAVSEGEESAANERKVMFHVEELLRRLEEQAKTKVDHCPIGDNGKVCSGYGSCNKYRTKAGKLVEGCLCSSRSRVGKDCSGCAFGFRTINQEGGGTQCVRDLRSNTISFLQMGTSSYSADDLNDLVNELQSGTVPEAKSATVKSMLSALRQKLDTQVQVLRVELSKMKSKREALEQKWLRLKNKGSGSSSTLASKKKSLEKATLVLEQFRAKYDMENGMRKRATTILAKLSSRLEGMSLFRDKKKQQLEKMLGYTKAPTTMPPLSPTNKKVMKILNNAVKQEKAIQKDDETICKSRWTLKECFLKKKKRSAAANGHKKSIPEQIATLFKLKQEGALTMKEYAAAKTKLLSYME
jgi:hypothetical protein